MLEALAALTAGAPTRFEPEVVSGSGREELAQSNLGVTVLSSVLSAVQRKNQVYQTAAMKVSSPSSTVGSKNQSLSRSRKDSVQLSHKRLRHGMLVANFVTIPK